MENFGIGSWLQRRRPKSGSKTALISGDREISYQQLADRSVRLANALRDSGVAKFDRVAYLGDNHPSFLETLFACGQLGAIFVPLNARLAPPEVQFQLQDCGAATLIHAGSLDVLAAAGAAGTLVNRRIAVDDSSGEQGTTAAEDFEAVLASGSDQYLDEAVDLDDGAMILYTSGTTGHPKGALLTHGNIVWNCMNVIVDFDFASTDVALMIS
ncbi:MAG TPA: p-hydroxycinnamoyl-CoA synthetase, partial [Arthrobacter bacterium]|nr:p-hydroxycinnamoyl-CoA synthetase [Arthrobacter sp.]